MEEQQLDHVSPDDLPFWSAAFGLALLDTIRFHPRMEVLDIGSGSGFPMLEVAGRLGSNSRVTGIDPDPVSISLVEGKIRERDITNAVIMKGQAEHLPFPDLWFDLVISNNGMNNVQDIEQSFTECFRVLKAGGQMIFTVNLPHTFEEFYQVFEAVLKHRGMHNEVAKKEEHIFEKRKPARYLRDMAEETGFYVTSVRVDSFRYRFQDGNAFYRHYMIRNYFMPAWRAILPDGKADAVLSETCDRLNRLAAANGWIEMSVPFATFDLSK